MNALLWQWQSKHTITATAVTACAFYNFVICIGVQHHWLFFVYICLTTRVYAQIAPYSGIFYMDFILGSHKSLGPLNVDNLGML